jgi:hypothetical protein
MTTVVYPSLRLSANGATALLDQYQRFQVYALPTLNVRIDAPSAGQSTDVSAGEFDRVILSASGTAIVAQTLDNKLVLLSATDQPQYQLPIDPALLRAMAIADAGDQLATLAIAPTANADQPNGVLAIWSLSAGGGRIDQPIAMTQLPLLDRSILMANGAFNTFAIRSTALIGRQQFMEVYRRELSNGALSSLWTEQGDVASVAVMLYGDWVWAVQDHAMVGWHQHHPSAKLAATLREQLIYSPSGGHLLAYRGAETIDVTTQKMLFRLIDLASCQEIRRTTQVIPHYNEARFALTDHLSLLELRATRKGELTVKELEWTMVATH